MFDSLERVLCLNNDAISLVNIGDEEKAVGCLSESLTILRELLIQQGAARPPSHSHSSSSFKDPRSSPVLHVAQGLSALPNQWSFVYNNVLLLSSIEAPSQDAVQVYTASVIYNLAVVHQRRGILRCERSCLEKATRLYQMSLRILSSVPDYESGTALLLKLVARNNLSQIHYEQEDFLNAQDQLVSLASLLSTEQYVCDLFEDHEFEGLLANVMLLCPPLIAAAA